MENAVEALKIAFAVGMFVLALTLSMSSFSNASSVVTSIIEMRDRETEYTYVEPSENLARIVGIETVVSTMYRAFQENIEIYFFDSAGEPIALYYYTDPNGNQVKDENGEPIEVSSINLEKEGFDTRQTAKQHLDIILGGEDVLLQGEYEHLATLYDKKIIHKEGLYEFFKNSEFEESLGEYYQGTGAAQIKKRVITYKLKLS